MENHEFNQLVEGATERPGLEFKGDCAWDAPTMAKDVLAMANHLFGGHIIFGIDDDGIRVGLGDQNAASFDEETIMDQLMNFADPYVSIRVRRHQSDDGTKYVIITVAEFDELPVMCRRDSKDAKKGALYIRPRSGRPRSEDISDTAELRDLIDRSVAKRMHKLAGLGFKATNNDADEFFDKEIGDL